VQARLRRSARVDRQKRLVFWIVRPEVGPASISGLRTVFTGPYIRCCGHGPAEDGVRRPRPAAPGVERAG